MGMFDSAYAQSLKCDRCGVIETFVEIQFKLHTPEYSPSLINFYDLSLRGRAEYVSSIIYSLVSQDPPPLVSEEESRFNSFRFNSFDLVPDVSSFPSEEFSDEGFICWTHSPCDLSQDVEDHDRCLVHFKNRELIKVLYPIRLVPNSTVRALFRSSQIKEV